MATALDTLVRQRDELLDQARAKVANLRITSSYEPTGNEEADAEALRSEISELQAFVGYTGPGLYLDTEDEDADGENVDPTNI
ncbi:hypothetical protein [Streptomyces sp. NPDC059761]|uniref:hypothetical protein n=1 Tax=Streptomyces sp. NPDC059761 TaxID=3346937 RepID=UPI0036600058